MKRIILIFAILTSCTLTSLAQSVITGTLKDSLTQEGEPYATIRVYKGQGAGGKGQEAGSKGQEDKREPVAMSVSGLDGDFRQTVNGKGSYVITFNSVGRKEIRRTVTLDGKNTVNLGTLLFSDDAQQLQGVEVVAQKPLVKMETDKMTYNVGDDVDSKTATVLDMLRKVPMVTVDGQDNITVNGSSSFKVYVNGKPNMMFNSNPSQIFKAMPASMVKNIEVVTNPGAKYDAEGTGGVLNIVMAGQGESQTQVNGINGNLRTDLSNKGSGGGGFLSGQFGKFSFSLNAMLSDGRAKGTETTVERENLDDGSFFRLRQKGTTKMMFGMVNANMGYELDTMSTLGLTVGFRNFGMKNTGNPTTTMGNALNYFTYSELSTSENKNRSLETSLDYQRFLNKARTSSITMIYQFSYDPTHNQSSSIVEDDQNDELSYRPSSRISDSREKTITHVAQTDYTTPLSEKHKLNLGMKYTSRLQRSNADMTWLSPQTTEVTTNRNNNDILAGYAEYEGKFGKIGTKAGLRYEHTWQQVKWSEDDYQVQHKTHYGNMVPTASVTWQMLSFANLGLTYNMRLSRPGISYLNPYVDQSSVGAKTYGNPDLDVEKSHQIGIVYNMYTPKFMTNVNIRQSITNNGISQYSFYDGENLLNTTYGNIMRQRSTTMSIWANLMLSQKTRIFMNGGFGYFHMESNGDGNENVNDNDNGSGNARRRSHGWQGNCMTGLQQTLPWDLKLGTFFITNSKVYSLDGWRTGFNMLMANITKSFLNDKLSVGIQGFTGLRKGGKLHFDSYGSGRDFRNRTTIHVPVARLQLTMSWNFGNSKVQAKTKTTQVENDVINQTNSMEQMNNMGQGM